MLSLTGKVEGFLLVGAAGSRELGLPFMPVDADPTVPSIVLGGAWLAPSLVCVTLDLEVVSLSPRWVWRVVK